MNSSEKYAQVSAVIGEFEPFIGAYLSDKVTKFKERKISGHELITEIRFIDRKLEKAETDLRMISFRRMKQRREFSKFIGGVRQYRKALSLMIRAVETNDESAAGEIGKRLDSARGIVQNYGKFMFLDRMKEAR